MMHPVGQVTDDGAAPGCPAALSMLPGTAGMAFLREIPEGALLAKVAVLPSGQWVRDVEGWVIPDPPAQTFTALNFIQ